MRQINFRFLIILLVSTTVLIGGSVILHGYQAGETEKMWRRKSEDAEKEGNYRLAVVELRKFIGKHVNDPEIQEHREHAALMACKVLKQSDRIDGDVRIARNLLVDARKNAVAGSEVYFELLRELSDLYVKGRLYAEAEPLLKELTTEDPNDAASILLAARCALVLKKLPEAEAKLIRLVGGNHLGTNSVMPEEVEALAADNIEAYRLLADHYTGNDKNPEKANRVMERMVVANPESALALLARGQWRLSQALTGTNQATEERKENGKKDIRTALSLEPDNIQVLLVNAGISRMDQDMETSKKHLQHALEVDSKNRDVMINLAELSLQMGDSKEAIQHLNKAIKAHPNNGELLWRRGMVQLSSRDSQGMTKTLEDMKQLRNFNPLVTDTLRALIPFAKESWAEAKTKLESVQPRVSNNPTLYRIVNLRLAYCYEQLHNTGRALATYKAILLKYPSDDAALNRSLDILIRLKRLDEASKELNLRLTTSPDGQLPPSLQGVHSRLVTALAKRDPERYRHLLEVAPGDAGSDSPDEAKDEPTKILEKALALSEDDKDGEAIETLRSWIKNLPEEEKAKPTTSRVQYELVSHVLRTDGANAALTEMDAQNWESNPLQALAYRAQILAKIPTAQGVKGLLQIENNLDQFDTKEQTRIMGFLGSAYAQRGELGLVDARRCWMKAYRLQPQDPTYLAHVFELDLRVGNNERMEHDLETIEKTFGRDDPLWKFSEASRIRSQVLRREVDLVELEKALRLVESALEDRPDWHALVRLQAQIVDNQGDIDTAIGLYKRAFELGKVEAAPVVRLIQLHMQRAQSMGPKDQRLEWTNAWELMRGAGSLVENLHEQRAFLTVQLTGDPSRAVKAIEKFVPKYTADWRRIVQKGNLYKVLAKRFSGHPDGKKFSQEVETAFQLAIDKAPHVPDAWLPKVEYLAETDRVDEAESLLRLAENQLPDDSATWFMARGYYKLGQADRAEHYFLSALDRYPENIAIRRILAKHYYETRQVGKANQQLELILRTKPTQENINHIIWARGRLADIYAGQGDYQSDRKAIQVINETATRYRRGVLTRRDGRKKALLLAKQPYPSAKLQAILLLEEMKRMVKLDTVEEFNLAKLYFQSNRWSQANDLMGRILSERRSIGENSNIPEETAQVAFLHDYAAMFLAMGEKSQGKSLLEKMMGLQGESPNSIRLYAHYLSEDGRKKEAHAQIQKLIPKGEVSSENAAGVQMAANLFDQIGSHDLAEKNFRILAEKIPQLGPLALAEFLAKRQETVSEALEIVEQNKNKDNVEQVTRIGMLAMKSLGARATKEQQKTIDDWFAFARLSKPDNFNIQTNQAAAASMGKNLDKSIKIYREILKQPKLKGVQRGHVSNNLAYFLAVQGKDLDEAQQLAEDSLKVLGRRPGILDTLAVVYLAQKKCDLSVKTLQEATAMSGVGSPFDRYITRSPDDGSQMFFHLALAHQCSKNMDQAKIARDQARERDFDVDEIWPMKITQWERLNLWLPGN